MPADSETLATVFIPLDRDTRLGLMRIAREKGGVNPLELAAQLLRDRVQADVQAIQPVRFN